MSHNMGLQHFRQPGNILNVHDYTQSKTLKKKKRKIYIYMCICIHSTSCRQKKADRARLF